MANTLRAELRALVQVSSSIRSNADELSFDMTRADLIAQAERHVRLGEGHIYRQQQILAQVAESGASTDACRGTAELLQSLQNVQVEHLERLRDQ